MASIIKNQILKYLSRYFKNLSTDKINFNAIKGEGKLEHLELDEIAITDLLELPSWMAVKSASCNRVLFTIPWTKIKSESMVWNLDEVSVEVETCEELRNMQDGIPTVPQQQGSYNTINRIVDAMTINVNTVYIKFSSSTFVASLQILRIRVESKSPTWEKCEVRHSRIKDAKRGQVLLFKELSWQTVRIEAKSIIEENLPPLRLLTNEAVCRIAIKKRLSDCFIMGSKLVLILNELLWVLTDAQLKAALHFLDSLAGLIKKANDLVRKKKAARKLEMLPEYQAQLSQQEMKKRSGATEKLFEKNDIVETSYHFIAEKVDLHLSDDPGPGRSSNFGLKDGAAIQIKLTGFQVDFYPYHLAAKDRNHWGLYKADRYPHPKWLIKSQNEFKSALLDLVRDTRYQNEISYSSPSIVRRYLMEQFNKIMTSCVVLRITDFTVNKVTTPLKMTPKEFIKAERERYSLGTTESEILHAEFTYYYYPGDVQFPLPPPKFYVQLYPVVIEFDVMTILWLNTFFLNLHKSLMTTNTAQQQQQNINQFFYVDVKFEAIMPQVIFEVNDDKISAKDKPHTLHFQVSRIKMTNERTPDCNSTKQDLARVIAACQTCSLFLTEEFPSTTTDPNAVDEKFIKHLQGKDNIRSPPSPLPSDDIAEAMKMLHQELLWVESKDVWCIQLDSIWGEFYGIRAVASRPVTLVDAFPFSLWLYMNPMLSKTKDNNNEADIHILAHTSSLISLQVNHYQALFLATIAKQLSEVVTFLTIDTNKITGEESESLLVIACLIPQVEVTLVTSSQDSTSNAKISSEEAGSSTVPDSSSLDTRSLQWNHISQPHNNEENVLEDKWSKSNAKFEEQGIASIFKQNSSENYSFRSKTTESTVVVQYKRVVSNFKDLSKSFTDDSDTVSIRSDDSSDAEGFTFPVAYMDDTDAMFRTDEYKKRAMKAAAEELAVEVADDAMYSSNVTSSSATLSDRDSVITNYRRRDLVAATTIKLGKLECLVKSAGLISMVKIQVSNIALEECISIPWDELQSKFSSRTRDWNEIACEEKIQACVKIRLENEVKLSNRISDSVFNIDEWRDSMLSARFADILLHLRPTIFKCFAEFFDADTVSEFKDQKIIPFEIFVCNTRLVLKSESPSNKLDENSTCLHIKRLKISSDGTGVITIEPMMIQSPANNNESPGANGDTNTVKDNNYYYSEQNTENIALKAELDFLRKRLSTMEYLSEENNTLRQYQEETRILRSCLNAAQDEVSALLEEKKSLLEYISKMRGSYHPTENQNCPR